MAGKVNLLASSNTLIIFTYISGLPGTDLLAKEIQKATKISNMGVHLALGVLEDMGFISSNKKGKSFTYRLNHKNPVVKQFKILSNVIELQPLCEKLKEETEKIILFGSAARGEDSLESDYDLFVLARDREAVEEDLIKISTLRKVNAKVLTEVQAVSLKKNDPVFFAEIECGITIWENEK